MLWFTFMVPSNSDYAFYFTFLIEWNTMRLSFYKYPLVIVQLLLQDLAKKGGALT